MASLWTRLIFIVLIGWAIASCGTGGADADGEPDIRTGQITRPANAGLPLDDPRAVQAYARAEQLLIDWFFRRDVDAALSHFSSDLRPARQPLLKDTAVDGDCSFTQTKGTQPDADGTVLARYAIENCEVTPPGGAPASAITVIVTLTEQNAWVVGVKFE